MLSPGRGYCRLETESLAADAVLHWGRGLAGRPQRPHQAWQGDTQAPVEAHQLGRGRATGGKHGEGYCRPETESLATDARNSGREYIPDGLVRAEAPNSTAADPLCATC